MEHAERGHWQGSGARMILGLGASTLMVAAGVAVSSTGPAAFFGIPLALLGVLGFIATPYAARANPAKTPCPWCSSKVDLGTRRGPILCPECSKTIVIGPPEEKQCAC